MGREKMTDGIMHDGMTEQQWRDACENALTDKSAEVEAMLQKLGLFDHPTLGGWYREVMNRNKSSGGPTTAERTT
jgi:hypothetical protein